MPIKHSEKSVTPSSLNKNTAEQINVTVGSTRATGFIFAMLFATMLAYPAFSQSPSVQFGIMASGPGYQSSTGCAGSDVYYVLHCVSCTFSGTPTFSASTASVSDPTGYSDTSDDYVRNVVWQSDGVITVTYTVSGSSTGNEEKTSSFNVTEAIAGTISGPTTVCSNASGNLSISGNQGGTNNAVTWYKCTTGCLGTSSSGWEVKTDTSYYSNISMTTKFMAKLNFTGCGDKFTNIITVNKVDPSTSLLQGDAGICSGQDADLVVNNPKTGTSYQLFKVGTGNIQEVKHGNDTLMVLTWHVSSTGTYKVIADNSPCVVDLGPKTLNALSPGTLSIAKNPDVPVCSGGTVTLTASGGYGYGWSAGGAADNILTVHPTSSTSYTVSGHESNCDTEVETTVSVGIKAPGTATATKSPTSNVCAGTDVELTGNGLNDYTWTWTGGSATGTPTGSPSGLHLTARPSTANATTTFSVSGHESVCGTSISVSNIISVTTSPNVGAVSINSGTTSRCKAATGTDTYAASASNATGYSWGLTSGAGSISSGGVVTWSTSYSGTATVSVTASGCGTSTTDTYDVVVKPLPVASISAAKTTCSGVALNLTPSSDIGGTTFSWATQNISHVSGYTSTPGTPPSTISETLTATSGTTDGGIRYTITPSAASCSGTAVVCDVTVKRKPTATITPSFAICPGTTAALAISHSNTITGTSYSWTSSATSGVTGNSAMGSTGSISDILDTTSPSGTATYVGTASLNGCSTTAQSTVSFYPAVTTTPTVTGNNVFANSPVPLPLTASGALTGQTYRWYNPAGTTVLSSVSTYTTPNVSSTTSNYLYVTLANSNSCLGPKVWVTIYVHPIPVISATNDYVFKGQESVLSTTAYAYDVYSWKKDGSAVGSASTYQTSAPASYTVTVTKNGLSTTSAAYPIKGQFEDMDANYVITSSPQVAGMNSSTVLESKTVDLVAQSVQYYDGLGRPLQTVGTQASPQKSDLVQPAWYDSLGRNSITYLPFAAQANGRLKTNVVRDDGMPTGSDSSFYKTSGDKIVDDLFPYSKTVFELSPLGRPLKQGAPGEAWQPEGTHAITRNYQFNTSTDVVRLTYNPSTGLLTGSSTTYYAANSLSKNITVDEEGNDVIEFVDKLGRTICKKVKVSGSDYASTYYIYDNIGNLTVVLPPEAIKQYLLQN